MAAVANHPNQSFSGNIHLGVGFPLKFDTKGLARSRFAAPTQQRSLAPCCWLSCIIAHRPKAFFTRSEVYLALASSFTVGVPCQTFWGSIWNKF